MLLISPSELCYTSSRRSATIVTDRGNTITHKAKDAMQMRMGGWRSSTASSQFNEEVNSRHEQSVVIPANSNQLQLPRSTPGTE